MKFYSHILTLLMLLTMQGIATADEIALRSSVQLEAGEIKLRDIASLDGPEAVKLGDLVLGSLSTQGFDVTLAQVRAELDKQQVNWGRLTLRGFVTCQVRVRQEIKPQPVEDPAGAAAANPATYIHSDSILTLRDRLAQELVRHSGLAKDEVRITFQPRDDKTLNQSILQDRWEIEPLNSAKLGRVMVNIRRWRDDRICETTRITAEIAQRTLAVVAKNDLKRNELIHAADVEIQEVYLDDANRQPVVDLQAVIGKVARQNMRAGSVVHSSEVELKALVKRGDRLVVRCVVGGLVIKTHARALESGSMDELIPVANLDSNERFQARIVGQGQAVLVDSAAPAQEKKS